MKKREIKRLLEENLSYPQLTVRADQAFLTAYSMLEAGREGNLLPAEGNRSSRAKHVEAAFARAEARHGKRRGARALLAVSLSLVLVFLGLLALNGSFPSVTENLPVLGEVFRAINGREKEPPAPVVSIPEESGVSSEIESEAEPELSESVMLERVESTPEALTVVLSYPAIGNVMTNYAMDAWMEVRTEDGTLLEGGFDRNASSLTGETQVGDPITYRASLPAIPEGTERIIVTLYNNAPYNTNRDLYVDGGIMGPCVFAEYTVDLETGAAEPSQTYLEHGYEGVDIDEYNRIMRGGPQFVDHIFHADSFVGWGKVHLPEESAYPPEETEEIQQLLAGFHTDEADLPLAVKFYVRGALYQTVPVAKTEEAVPINGGTGLLMLREDCAVQITERMDETANWKSSVKQSYSVFIYLDEENWVDTEEDWSYQIINLETGNVVFDSAVWVTPEHFCNGEYAEE